MNSAFKSSHTRSVISPRWRNESSSANAAVSASNRPCNTSYSSNSGSRLFNRSHFNSGATVSPCASRLKTTVPKTSIVNSVRYGSDSGRLNASAIESDPRNPPQNKTCLHLNGTGFVIRFTKGINPYTATTRERSSASTPHAIVREWANIDPSCVSSPTSRNTSELTTKAAYSQNELTATWVVGDMPARLP